MVLAKDKFLEILPKGLILAIEYFNYETVIFTIPASAFLSHAIKFAFDLWLLYHY